MSKPTFAAMVAVFASAAVIGCGDSSQAPANTPSQAAISSGVEDVPIPVGGKIIAETRSRTDTTRMTDVTYEFPGMSYDELLAWYRAEMPVGESFKKWEWCDTGGLDKKNTHIYAKGPKNILAVAVVDDSPPSVLIGVDKSGPC